MKFSSRWTTGLDAKSKAGIEKKLKANKALFDILTRMLNNKIQHVQSDRLGKDHYLKPAWPEYQAERNGYEKAMKEVLAWLPKEN